MTAAHYIDTATNEYRPLDRVNADDDSHQNANNNNVDDNHNCVIEENKLSPTIIPISTGRIALESVLKSEKDVHVNDSGATKKVDSGIDVDNDCLLTADKSNDDDDELLKGDSKIVVTTLLSTVSTSSSSLELIEVVADSADEQLKPLQCEEQQHQDNTNHSSNQIGSNSFKQYQSDDIGNNRSLASLVDRGQQSLSSLKSSDPYGFESDGGQGSLSPVSSNENIYLDIGINQQPKQQQQQQQQQQLVNGSFESQKVNLLASHLADSASSFVVSDLQFDSNNNTNNTSHISADNNLNNLNYHLGEHNNRLSTTNPILINNSASLFDHHHHHLTAITDDNDYHYCHHNCQHTISPSSGIFSLTDCNNLLHNQHTISSCSNRSPLNYLEQHQQHLSSPPCPLYSDQGRLHQHQQHIELQQQQPEFYHNPRLLIYNDFDAFDDTQNNGQHHQHHHYHNHHDRDATSFILINNNQTNDDVDNGNNGNNNNSNNNNNNDNNSNNEDNSNNNSYISQQNNDHQYRHNHTTIDRTDGDYNRQQNVCHNLEQTIMNNDHSLHHNDHNQYNVNSLMNSLNSSSSTIINGVHSVSIRELSSSNSKNNTCHYSNNVINPNCHNEDEFYPHTCRWSDCFLSFTDMPELVKHIEEAHVNSIPEEKHRYSCQWTNCRRTNQPFNARYKLLIHMRVHSGEKPYPCEHESCKKSFSRLENLKIHIRSHTGEKPYCCRYEGCKKAFTNSSDRIKHHKTHLDAKPYSCSYNDCDKRYTDPSSLRKHLKLHKRLDSDSNKIDHRLDYIDVIKNNSSLDDKLSQSWSAGYTKPCQINADGNWSTFTNDYTQSKLANSFTAGCSSSYATPIELHDSNFLNGIESNLPSFACLASKSLDSL